jgi:hypothetical protein
MGDEIAQLLREFEGAMTGFFAGKQRDDTRLCEARMRLYSQSRLRFGSSRRIRSTGFAGMRSWNGGVAELVTRRKLRPNCKGFGDRH